MALNVAIGAGLDEKSARKATLSQPLSLIKNI
jgi:hypothetical protein